jgi:hypothetical protein
MLTGIEWIALLLVATILILGWKQHAANREKRKRWSTGRRLLDRATLLVAALVALAGLVYVFGSLYAGAMRGF